MLAILLMLYLSQIVFAQTSDAGWSEPFNLSRSGGSSQPRIVVDTTGRINVLWIDDYAGLVASQGADGKWSAPVTIGLPYTDDVKDLKMAAGVNGLVHVAWSDSQGSLYYSQVRSENFTNTRLWGFIQRVGSFATDFDLVANEVGDTYLAYLRSEQSQQLAAGIYTVHIRPGGGLATPNLLYASPYFRGLKPGEAQVSLAAAGDKKVYIAWDEPAKGQVWLAVSNDGGDKWSEARSMDQRQPEDGAGVNPARPYLSAMDQQVLMVWQAGHQGSNCAQYSQASQDGGTTWGDIQRLPEALGENCANDLQLLPGTQGGAWLLADMPSGVLLSNWQANPATGGTWSAPSMENELSGFSDPQTYRLVLLDCQTAALDGERLLVVSCEQQQKADARKGDIWLLERPLNQPANVVLTPTTAPIWSTPALLDSSAEILDEPLLVAEQSGRLHAFWTRQEESGLYYAGWDGERWSPSQAVLESPDVAPQGLTATLFQGDLLFVVWSDTKTGKLYYSLAPHAQAENPVTWLATQELPGTDGAAAPQAIARRNGKLAVTYAVPFNERRGIYLVESRAAPQAGKLVEWSAPETVFDAAAAGWESLSDPSIAEDANGSLYLLWTRYNLPPNAQANGLYATHSSINGWTQFEEVGTGQVVWSQILATLDGGLHRAWQEKLNGKVAVFHQYSMDKGQSWSKAERLSGIQASGPVGMAVDAGGRLFLLQVAQNLAPGAGTAPELQQWIWQAGTWTQAESQGLSGLISASALSAAAPPGSLAALYSGLQEATPIPLGTAQPVGNASPEPSFGMFYSARQLGLETGAPAVIAPGQALVTPITSGIATPIPSPTPIPTFSSQPPSGLGSFLGEQGGVIMLGIIPGIFLIGLGFYLAARGFGGRR